MLWSFEMKMFLLKLGSLCIFSPVAGFFLLKFADYAEQAWKANNRRKKWIVISVGYFCLQVLSGFLR